MKIIYRPEWTCGRYNKSAKVAIYYNLIEGMSYYFEDESAAVIGTLLSVSRNESISIQQIERETGLPSESLVPFIQELSALGLCCTNFPSAQIINEYRANVHRLRCQQRQTEKIATKDKLPMAISSAEMDYSDRVGGITSVMLELTYRCSEKCIHCYNIGATRNDEEPNKRGDLEELSLADYYRIIDELNEQGLIKVCLSGGDPFSNQYAWDIIDYLHKKEIAFDVFTNGQRLVNSTEKLAEYYPRLVGISLYSGIAEVHDAITRQKGSWEKTMSVIKQLSVLAVPMNLKCCIMRPNVKSYYMVGDIATLYGAVPQFEINVTDSIDGDKCVSKHLRLPYDALELVLRDDNIPLYVGKEAPSYGKHSRPITENACGAGYNSFCITPNGDLIPCCAFHLSFGNLKEKNVKDIYANSEVLKWWNGLSLQHYEECGKHDYCEYCNLCAGVNHSEHGTPLKAGENNCQLAKARYELARKMMNGYDPLHGQSIKAILKNLPEYRNEELKQEYTK